MKYAIATVLAVCLFGVSQAELSCELPQVTFRNEDWRDMTNGCINKVKEQIQKEINASMTYLAMAAHFSRDTINRPGFANFFFESAAEEREHGHKLVEYLLMRGQLVNGKDELSNLIKVYAPTKAEWTSGLEALKDALDAEASVTKSIRQVIKACENDETEDDRTKEWPNNDYHLVDYLTGTYLEEQYNGQRAIAGKISTLEKMTADHGPIAEFLFDKKNF